MTAADYLARLATLTAAGACLYAAVYLFCYAARADRARNADDGGMASLRVLISLAFLAMMAAKLLFGSGWLR